MNTQDAPTIQTVPLRLCRFEDMPIGIGIAFEVGARSIALFRTRTDSVHAVDNCCPHKGGPLADGMIAGSQVVCPLHAHRYRLTDGHCDTNSQCSVAVYPTCVMDGWVHVEVPSASTSSKTIGEQEGTVRPDAR